MLTPNVSNKRVKHNLDSTYLWHCRLAHINKKRIKQLQQDGLLKSTDDESFDKYESCLSGKMTKKHFPHSNERAKVLFRIIHTDVCGPLRHVSRQDASYFITFTDDYSRYGYSRYGPLRRGSIPMLATSLLLHLHTTTPITIGHNSHHRCSFATPHFMDFLIKVVSDMGFLFKVELIVEVFRKWVVRVESVRKLVVVSSVWTVISVVQTMVLTVVLVVGKGGVLT
ncbi:retrotransposon protein, putative, ty1-copia subclass, partial [Tanacetum coccineum]